MHRRSGTAARNSAPLSDRGTGAHTSAGLAEGDVVESGLWAAAVVGVCVLLSLAGMLLVRRSIAVSTLEEHSEVAGFVYAVLGVIYAVLMAFIVIVVWEQFDRAETVVDQEANAIVDLSRLAESLPEPERSRIQDTLLAYVHAVVDDEWDLMAEGEASPRAVELIDALWRAYRRIEPRTNQESAAYQQSLQELDDLSDARSLRLLLARPGLPHLMWATLIVGALITVTFSFLFDVKRARAQFAIVAPLTTTVVLVLLLIGALDHPFDGLIGVAPGAFEAALTTIERATAATPGR